MTFVRFLMAMLVAVFAAAVVESFRTSSAVGACDPPGVSADSGFRAYLVEFEAGANLFMNGDPDLLLSNVSHGDDVTLLNPFGYNARGWTQVGTLYRENAKRFIPSNTRASVEYLAIGVDGNFAYTVTTQRATVRRIGDPGLVQAFTRSTNIFRREHCRWKLVHRQMDHNRTPE